MWKKSAWLLPLRNFTTLVILERIKKNPHNSFSGNFFHFLYFQYKMLPTIKVIPDAIVNSLTPDTRASTITVWRVFTATVGMYWKLERIENGKNIFCYLTIPLLFRQFVLKLLLLDQAILQLLVYHLVLKHVRDNFFKQNPKWSILPSR